MTGVTPLPRPGSPALGRETRHEEWQVRLAAAVAVHKRRRQLREQVRAQLAAARKAGLEQRHRRKLARAKERDE